MAGKDRERITTGIAGLDELLLGGVIPRRAYLIRGGPGTGKTLLGMSFLAGGLQRGETCMCLFISLSESEEKLRDIGESVGLEVESMHFLDLTPPAMLFSEQKTFQFFSAAEAERGPMAQRIVEAITRLHPSRVVVDSATHLRYLTPDPLQFRRELLSFLRYLTEQGITVYLLSEVGASLPDDDLQFMTDGVITLSSEEYLRTVEITKYVTSGFVPGKHTVRISDDGVRIFPGVRPTFHLVNCEAAQLSSGVPELDVLLHGGLECGTSTFISGPSGSGKTTFGLSFVQSAAARGDRTALFAFDTSAEIIVRQAEGLGFPAREWVARGLLSVIPIPSLYYSLDELTQMIREEVETHDARLVMLDGYNGSRQSLLGADFNAHLHEVLAYLNEKTVTTLAMLEVEKIVGDFQITQSSISYLADNIIFLRYLEINGHLRKAIGVLKKRLSDFEKTLREFEVTAQGVRVGKPLTGLRGILKGEPEWVTPPREEDQ